MIDPRIQAAGEFLAGLEGEDREKAVRDLKAILALKAPPESLVPMPTIRPLGEYLNWEIPIPPELATPYVVVRGGITATIGRSGKGKTVMNLNRLLRWAAGLPFFDGLADALVPPMPLRVLVIENEGAAGLFQKQIRTMVDYGPFTPEQRDLIKENVQIWGDGGYSDLTLDKREDAEYIERGVEKAAPDIIFIEPFRGLWEGDENSSTDMTVVVKAMQRIATNYNAGIIVAHHEVKHRSRDEDAMNAARGSGVLENFVVAMENFEPVKGDVLRELSWSKSRHAKAPAPVRMEWDSDRWWYSYVAPEQGERIILNELATAGEMGLGVGDLVDLTEENDKRVRKNLLKLKDDGLVRRMNALPGREGGPRWVLIQSEDAERTPRGGLDL